MKKALITILMTILPLLPLHSSVQAAAYGTQFTTSITYQNVGNAPANIILLVYPENSSSPIQINLPQLNPFAGASIYVGWYSEIRSGFLGSAILQSDQPLIATLVQVPPSGSNVKVRPLSNAFNNGNSLVLIPTVLKNMFGFNSIISIQNVDNSPVDLDVEFVPVGGTPFVVKIVDLPTGAAKYFDMGSFSHPLIGQTFNGSMRVTAKRSGSSDPGKIVATSLELGITSNNAYSFEGATEFSNILYMPSAFCKYTNANYMSVYAVQNVGSSPIAITVRYSNGNSETYDNVSSGAKVSINGCGKNGNLNPPNFIGSATIEGTGPITGMAKISTGTGMITAFLGFTGGSSKIALPFVRWTSDAFYNSGQRSRTVLAIQNIGDSDLLANQVKVDYYDKNGNKVGTHYLPYIPKGGKVNSRPIDASPSLIEFGYYSDGTYGGSAVVTGPSDAKLAVIARVSTNFGGVLAAEDYNGIPIK